MLKNIRIVLVAPSHPGNIGATARALKNMGLARLYLVKPKLFPHAEATVRAAGADEILAAAVVSESLVEALTGCKLVLGTSARLRALPLPTVTPRAGAELVRAEPETSEIAIVFGRESSGLKNEELQLCHYQLNIPTAGEFSSLNLAAAVQVVVYELWQNRAQAVAPQVVSAELASAEELAYFYEHLHQVLVALKFLNPKHSKKLMQRLQRLFNRARMERTELNILRGILTAMQDKL